MTVVRRNQPGTADNEFNNWPREDIDEVEDTLSVQQHIQQAINKDPSDVQHLLDMPKNQDEAVWKYEHIRFVS